MNITPIKTEQDYQEALRQVERLMDAQYGTSRGDKLDVLTTLIEAWEEKHYPIDFPDPVDALTYWLENRGLERKDLEKCLGSRARVSEVLSRKRGLSLAMIQRLHRLLHIPAEVLITPIRVRKSA